MEAEFEVKGPEESAVEKHVEHDQENGGKGFASKVALLTAILSTVGAFYGYNAGKTLSDAMMFKNEAGMIKTDAANQWAFYQAKSTKQAIMEGALLTSPEEQKAKIEERIKRYDGEKEDIKKKAEGLEHKAELQNEASEHILHAHHKWATATTAIQIAIALSAIAILTRRKWLFYGALGVSAVSLVLGVLSWMAM
jgi:hypothetical protein